MATNLHGTEAYGGGYVDFAKSLFDMYVERTFIERLEDFLIAHRTAKASTLPDKMGKNVRWNFLSPVTTGSPATTTPLAEGGDPSGSQDFTLNSPEATLLEYGGYTRYTKFLDLTAVSGTLDEIIDAVAFQASLTVDTLFLTECQNITTVVDAGGAMSAEALRTVSQTLVDNRARPHPMSPGGRFYLGVFDTEPAYDMMGEGAPTWVQAKRDDIASVLQTPFEDTPASSAVYGIMVKISQNILVDGSSPVNNLNYVFGRDSVGAAALATDVMQPSIILTTPEQHVDVVLRNRGTIGFWFLYVAKVLDSNRAVEVLSDVT